MKRAPFYRDRPRPEREPIFFSQKDDQADHPRSDRDAGRGSPPARVAGIQKSDEVEVIAALPSPPKFGYKLYEFISPLTPKPIPAIAPDEPAPARQNELGEDLAHLARLWIEANPIAYAQFLALCRAEAEAGRRFGFKQVAEKLRREVALRADHNGFKLNNNVIAYIGRRAIQDAPEIRSFVRLREVHF